MLALDYASFIILMLILYNTTILCYEVMYADIMMGYSRYWSAYCLLRNCGRVSPGKPVSIVLWLYVVIIEKTVTYILSINVHTPIKDSPAKYEAAAFAAPLPRIFYYSSSSTSS